MRIPLYALALTFVASRPLAAQFPAEVALGARVRVVLPDSLRQPSAPTRDQWLRGEVAALAVDTLYLRLQGAESPLVIRRASIKRIDRSLGVPTRAESAVRAGVGWAFLGALFGLATGWPDFESHRDRSPGDRAALGATWGAGAGFVLGALFPSERWRRVRLR